MHLQEAFIEWIRDYPIEGGIQIRSGEGLSLEKIAILKSTMLRDTRDSRRKWSKEKRG